MIYFIVLYISEINNLEIKLFYMYENLYMKLFYMYENF